MTKNFNKEHLWQYKTSSVYWEFCLNNTCFIFQGRFHEQTEGAALGSPLSPTTANLYMEAFENKTLLQHHIPLPLGEGL